MDDCQFRLPVRLKLGADPIREIYSAEEALDFLFSWHRQSGPVFDAAMEACFAATVNVESCDEAQKAFKQFARLSGILAHDMLPTAARKAAVILDRGH